MVKGYQPNQELLQTGSKFVLRRDFKGSYKESHPKRNRKVVSSVCDAYNLSSRTLNVESVDIRQSS